MRQLCRARIQNAVRLSALGGFVAAEVFLGLGEDDVLAKLGAVLLEA